MYIVSANYRDRKSSLRWLIRDAGQKPDEAQAVSAIFATGVIFCPASDYEVGFGCSTVAHCRFAVEGRGERVTDATRIHFDGYGGFYTVVNGQNQYVDGVAQLELRADGSIHASLNAVDASPSVPATA